MSKRGGTSKGGGAKALNKEKSTPSGYTYEEFMSKSLEEREDIVIDILNNEDITPPSYMEDSATSKLIWALGLDGKPQVMKNSELDLLPGEAFYRTVTSNKYLDRKEIFDQVSYGDYTRLSDSGGSAHGHAIYFAGGEHGLYNSLSYGWNYENSAVMKAKFLKTAKITTEDNLEDLYGKSYTKFTHAKIKKAIYGDDRPGVAAIMHGYDGWTDGNYKMILNRSSLGVVNHYKKFPKQGNNNSSVIWEALETL